MHSRDGLVNLVGLLHIGVEIKVKIYIRIQCLRMLRLKISNNLRICKDEFSQNARNIEHQTKKLYTLLLKQELMNQWIPGYCCNFLPKIINEKHIFEQAEGGLSQII